MRVPVFLLTAAIILVLPIALAAGGHNGATVVGVLIVILAIVLTIATSPTEQKK